MSNDDKNEQNENSKMKNSILENLTSTKDVNENITPQKKTIKNFIKSQPLTFNIINDAETNNNNNNSKSGKVRKKRRGKNETEGRNFICEKCNKSYLSAAALINHNKSKHSHLLEGNQKKRGRPRKELNNNNNNNNDSLISQNQKKFEHFFENEIRKIKTENDNNCTLKTIEDYISNVFRQCKDTLFKDIEKVENYSFYNFVVENWEKEDKKIWDECYSSLNLNTNDNFQIIKNPPLEAIIFYYLKEVSTKTNLDYFWFILKFIITFREFMNKNKENLISKSKYEDRKFYTEMFSAENIPDVCNDFFLDFMEPNNYFGLNVNELIELIQDFWFWLFNKKYTQSNLTLINN